MAAKINDVEISCQGIDLLISNDWDASENLFKQHKDQSPLMHYCYSFVTFMRAIMTFEEPLLDQAQKELENTEKMCTESSKVFSSFKKAFGISSSASSQQLKQIADSKPTSDAAKEPTLEDKYTKAIILADCKLYLAILTFIRQEVSGFLTSGILQIRRSWKMYAKAQKQLYEMYKKIEPNAEAIYGSDPNATSIQLFMDDNDDAEGDEKNGMKRDSSVIQLSELTITDDDVKNNISPEAIKRLLGAVSFGYGVFQICLSFMPPNILKLIKVFGFEGERSTAIKAINFTSNSKDMRAPFADMVLLWYATMATPLFGLSEFDLTISDNDTKVILEKNLQKYPKSALFYYYKGKYLRSLKNMTESLKCYEEAYNNAKSVREIQHISIYEIGWIHLMNLDYPKALEQFDILSKESKWSRSFNSYICAILAGGMGDFPKANAYIKEALKIIAAQTRKSNPVEQFGIKRIEYFKKNQINSKNVCEMLVIELLYLWVCIPYCDQKNLEKMLETLDKVNEKNLIALKCLFEGSINIELKNADFGEQCLNESLARAESDKMPFGKYVLPYAHYQLANYYTELKEFDQAKSHANKARDNYKDYELENRIQTQIKSLQRRLKMLTDGPKIEAALKARKEAEEADKRQKQADIDNFYV